MEGIKRLFGISVETKIPKNLAFILSILLFAIIIVSYFAVSYSRHVENPSDKVVPNIEQLLQGVKTSVSPDKTNGNIPLLTDTVTSLTRLFIAVIIAATFGILLGVHMGIFPIVEALFLRFVLILGRVPPLALIPIIILMSGLGEEMKIMLIVVGIGPPIILDTYFQVQKIPQELLVKPLTLGASRFEVVSNVLKQIMPSFLTTVRLNLLPAWLYVIASEGIRADSGLGYRIYLVRRYMAMDTIIPYVIWIALLAFSIDFLLSWWIKTHYKWYGR